MKNSGRKNIGLFRGKRRGFTIVEILIAMTLSLILLAGAYKVFTSQEKTYGTQGQLTEAIQNARVGLDFITRDLLMAGYIAEQWITGVNAPNTDAVPGASPFTADASADDIEEAGASAITFEGDIFSVAGEANAFTEMVRYSLSGTNLAREDWTWNGAAWGNSGGAQPIAENICALSFTYYDKDGAATADRSKICLIKISITSRTEKPDPDYTHPVNGDGYRTRTLTAYLRPRNLGL